MIPQSTLYVNFKAELILRICAIVRTNEHIAHIISVLDKIRDTTNEQTKIIFNMTDLFFHVPQGNLVLRRFEQSETGTLIFYKKHDSLISSSIGSYECLQLDNDILYLLTSVLSSSLHVTKQVSRVMHTFLLLECTSVIIEQISTVINFVHVQIVVKSSLKNVNKNCNDAEEIIRELMKLLNITELNLVPI